MVYDRASERERIRAYLVLGEGIVALLNEVLDFLHPLGESGPSPLEERLGPRLAVHVPVVLLKSLLVLLEAVKRPCDIRVDPHDQRGVDLDLVELLAERLVLVLAELVRERGKAVGKHLAALVPLRLGRGRRAVDAAVRAKSGSISHGGFGRGHCVLYSSEVEG